MATRWSPERYRRHAAPRLRPALDLLAHVELDAAHTVVDLGCGAGAVFPALQARFPKARLIGVDASPAMLAEAGTADPGVTLVEADAASWRPEHPVDLIFTNALLQWVPDHERLLPELMRCCRVLAMQIPANFEAPSHRLLRELMAESPWKQKLEGVRLGDHLLRAPQYHTILTTAGATVDAWETTYFHLLVGSDPVLDWLTGTTLLPIRAALAGDEAATFESVLAERLRVAYPPDARGMTLLPFRRLFVIGSR